MASKLFTRQEENVSVTLHIMRVAGIFAFFGFSIIVIIFSFLVPVDQMMEYLFIMHKKILIIMGILFIGAELVLFLIELLKKILKGVIDIKKLIKHLIWGVIFFIFLIANITIFETIVQPKLIKIEILAPQNNAEVLSPITNVEVSFRAVEGYRIYIIVETPQGTSWIQEKLFTSNFKGKLKGKAQLGELAVGIGRTFTIFAIATKKELPIGLHDKIPSDAIYSNIVSVRRVG